MQKAKRKRLEQAGWRVGSAAEFLELSPEETALIEMRLALSASLKARRLKQGLSQHALAQRLSSSQSRVAKMEAGDASVSLDLLIRALLATGAAPRDIARAISVTNPATT
ncbi:MAG: helix-turn-helix transcriptional regulator [Blastocatellia bacterium]